MYTDKATREYEQAIKNAYDGPVFEGPVSMSVTFKKNKILVTINDIEAESSLRGDIDNYIKSIMDGLNGVAYKDDGQVLNLKRIQEVVMPSKQIKGHAPSHDIEYKAGRRVNWKNDLAVGHKGEQIFQRLFRIFR